MTYDMNGPLFVLVHSFVICHCTFMKIYDRYIFEILIHFYPNLVVKLAKISPKMVVKNYVIFGKNPLSCRHQPS